MDDEYSSMERKLQESARRLENWKMRDKPGVPWNVVHDNCLPVIFFRDPIFPYELISWNFRTYHYFMLLSHICEGLYPPRFGVLSDRNSKVGVVVEIVDKTFWVGFARRVKTRALCRFQHQEPPGYFTVRGTAVAQVLPYDDLPPLEFVDPLESIFPIKFLHTRPKRRSNPFRQAAAMAERRALTELARKHPRASLLHLPAFVWDQSDEVRLAYKARKSASQHPWFLDLDENVVASTPRDDDSPYVWSMWLSSALRSSLEEKKNLLEGRCTAVRLRRIIAILELPVEKAKVQKGRSRKRRRISRFSMEKNPPLGYKESSRLPERRHTEDDQSDILLPEWPIFNESHFAALG